MEHFDTVFKIVKYVVLVVLSFITFILMINERCMLRLDWNGGEAELFCFATWGVTVLAASYDINGKIKRARNRVIVSAIVALAFTAIVILANNYFRYLGFNNTFNWVDPVSYGYFLKVDLTFVNDYAWLRYPGLFVCSFAGCFIAGIFGIGAEKEHREYVAEVKKLKLEKYKPGKLRKLYEKTFDKTHQKNFRQYLRENLYRDEIKQELIELIEEYKSLMLIRFLVGNFYLSLTDEEQEYYQDMFIKLMGEYLDDSVEKYNGIKEEWPDICYEILEDELDHGLFHRIDG